MILKIFILSISVLVVADILRVYGLIKKSKILVQNTIPFERIDSKATMKILVLGDSTAFGTGAEHADLSTAGRLGALYPDASVKNLAKNGLKLKGLVDILETIDSKERFSIILVQIGANDIIRLTKMEDVEKNAEKAFAKLAAQTDKLIILHSGDIGESRFFPIYTRGLLSKRSYEVREMYKKLASEYGASYIDLIAMPARETMRDNPDTYYANDYLHLNGEGYRLWFAEIEKALK